jgi:hypothetical protein
MTNDRHIAEVSFLARMVYLVIISCLDDAPQLEKAALEALEEPLSHIHCPKKKAAIKRRVVRMEEPTIKQLEGNSISGEEVLLTAYHFTEILIAEGYIEMPEDSTFAKVFDTALSLVNLDFPDTQQRFQEAKLRADKWIDNLRREGYYR